MTAGALFALALIAASAIGASQRPQRASGVDPSAIPIGDHYHSIPDCLSSVDEAGEHSKRVGWALDG